ncbi:MAG: amidohydrolase [Rhodospirillales bacterium]|nr:amidohydrolase [Rhodospirillales bacterium]
MTVQDGIQVIAIEEHYLDAEVDGLMGPGFNPFRERLADLSGVRIKEMDEAGIDIQVLSHCPPGAQAFGAEAGVILAKNVNDRLAEFVASKPDRFAAFATLPTQDPKGSADELERCVKDHGFKGAMVHGLTDLTFIDDKRFWPIFERAEALDVPIYVHPAPPHPQLVDIYLKDYVEDYPVILGPAWGFTMETATTGLRLVLSGVFKKYPKLRIILGHMGEGLPFLLWRINHVMSAMNKPGVDVVPFKEIFCEHFYITTSGNFSDAALLCSIMEMGADRILFSVDWPYIENSPGTDWMAQVPLGKEDRTKILSGNVKKLLKM